MSVAVAFYSLHMDVSTNKLSGKVVAVVVVAVRVYDESIEDVLKL